MGQVEFTSKGNMFIVMLHFNSINGEKNVCVSVMKKCECICLCLHSSIGSIQQWVWKNELSYKLDYTIHKHPILYN